MQKTITFDTDQLSDLLFRAAQLGANRALEQAGILKNIVTLAEIKKQHGKKLAQEARFAAKINWQPIGKGGRTSGVYCLRIEFEKFLFNREFDFLKK